MAHLADLRRSSTNLEQNTSLKVAGAQVDNLFNMTSLASSAVVTPLPTTVGLCLLFFVIIVIGVVGNCLVVVVIKTDMKMRQSLTNLIILNLAVADLIIMLLGVPEIVMFVINRGWLLGPVACRINRFILVMALYSSVISLVALCVERFVGIVFPLKVNELCTRRMIRVGIFIIWAVSILCGLPVIIYNKTRDIGPGLQHCQTVFPGSTRSYLVYKYTESVMFYFLPLVVQVSLYSIVAKHLYDSNSQLCSQFQVRSTCNGGQDSINDTMRARRGVVKMLVASVTFYCISYLPVQLHLIYSTFSRSSVLDSWHFFVLVMAMTHINSAANPVLYAIFSQNFRRNFARCLCLARDGFCSHHARHTRQSTPSYSRTHMSTL